MDRHYLKDEDGKDTDIFWSDSDGDSDPDHHQTLYEDTGSGAKERHDICYDRDKGKVHKR